jgi:hypothetical protein
VFEVKSPTEESPVETTPRSEEIPGPPAFVRKKLDVLEVKRATVESPVDQFCKVFWK